MFKALKDDKIIAINETGDFPCLVHDSVEEDTEHQLSDYVHCDGQFVLTSSDEAIEQRKKQVRAVRNSYLEQTDKYMITDYPITDDERELYKQYRTYLRTYPECQDWYKANPKTYEEWKSLQTTNNNDVSLEQMSDICKDYSESIEKLAKAVYYISQHSTERY